MKVLVKNNKKQLAAKQVGLFFEDINYSLDGGLYAEMLENNKFEYRQASGDNKVYETKWDCLYAWSADETNISLDVDSKNPSNDVNIHYVEVKATQKDAAFYNFPYEGIFLDQGEAYKVSFYARPHQYSGDVRIAVVKDNQIVTLGEIMLTKGDEWNYYEITVEAKESMEKGKFMIQLAETGEISFDCISMIPENAVMGIFRKDLVEKLKELKPAFLRFPGGCVVEGANISNRYRWKEGACDRVARRVNWNRWAVHDNSYALGEKRRYDRYNQSLGIGFYEYFLLCEYIGAAPVPIMNVGVACQFQSNDVIDINSPEFEEYVQDAIDLIEFANGSTDTKWGKIRASLGHEEPFGLSMVGIGNEQWETEQVNYLERYSIFEKRIHEKFPEIRLIGSAGTDVLDKNYELAWNFFRTEQKKNPNFVYAVDEHYYKNPQWFREHTEFYDSYPRDVMVFVGEYAAHHDNGMNRPELNDWDSALAEAVFMVGMERNADIVPMTAYAPLFARLGYTQWSPDLIWFDGRESYASPNYYMQKLFSLTHGDQLLDMQCEDDSLSYNATEDSNTGVIYIKLINDSSVEKAVDLNLEMDVEADGRIYVMAGEPTDRNSIEKAEKIALQENDFTVADGSLITMVLPPYSVQCLCLKRK